MVALLRILVPINLINIFFYRNNSAAIVASQVSKVNHPQYPNFEDFGEVILQGNAGMGFIRPDWFTPMV